MAIPLCAVDPVPAKSVWSEIPLLRGAEPPDVVTRAAQSVGHTRSAGVSGDDPLAQRAEHAADPDTGLTRPRGKRRGPTPPNSKGEAGAHLSRGSAGGGRAVHHHRGRTCRARTR